MESPWSIFLLFIPGVITRISSCCFSEIGCITGVNRGVNRLKQQAKATEIDSFTLTTYWLDWSVLGTASKQNDFSIEIMIILQFAYLVATLFARRSRMSSRSIDGERDISGDNSLYHPNLLWHWHREPCASLSVRMNACKYRPMLDRTLPSMRKYFTQFIRWWWWYLRKSERPMRTVLRSIASGHVDIWANRSFGDVKWFALNTHRTRRICGFA